MHVLHIVMFICHPLHQLGLGLSKVGIILRFYDIYKTLVELHLFLHIFIDRKKLCQEVNR